MNKLKMIVYKLIDYYLSVRYLKNSKKIIVASSGRAGSTMLYISIIKSFIQYKCRLSLDSFLGIRLYNLVSGFVERLEMIENSSHVILKTHDLWNKKYSGSALFIYVHGDPLESALSVQLIVSKKGQEWFKLHQYHLNGKGNIELLFIDDVLNYRNQIESWLGANSHSVLCLAYEELWEKTDKLSKFVGFRVVLPEQNSREAKKIPSELNVELFNELREHRKNLILNQQGVESFIINHF